MTKMEPVSRRQMVHELVESVVTFLRVALPDMKVLGFAESEAGYLVSVEIRRCGCVMVCRQHVPKGSLDTLTPNQTIGVFARSALLRIMRWRVRHNATKVWQHRWRPKPLDSLHQPAAR